jgi:hypothetical protein
LEKEQFNLIFKKLLPNEIETCRTVLYIRKGLCILITSYFFIKGIHTYIDPTVGCIAPFLQKHQNTIFFRKWEKQESDYFCDDKNLLSKKIYAFVSEIE